MSDCRVVRKQIFLNFSHCLMRGFLDRKKITKPPVTRQPEQPADEVQESKVEKKCFRDSSEWLVAGKKATPSAAHYAVLRNFLTSLIVSAFTGCRAARYFQQAKGISNRPFAIPRNRPTEARVQDIGNASGSRHR